MKPKQARDLRKCVGLLHFCKLARCHCAFGWSNECRKLKRKLLEAVRLTMLSFDAFMRATTAGLAGQE